jgi:hypothetical protein
VVFLGVFSQRCALGWYGAPALGLGERADARMEDGGWWENKGTIRRGGGEVKAWKRDARWGHEQIENCGEQGWWSVPVVGRGGVGFEDVLRPAAARNGGPSGRAMRPTWSKFWCRGSRTRLRFGCADVSGYVSAARSGGPSGRTMRPAHEAGAGVVARVAYAITIWVCGWRWHYLGGGRKSFQTGISPTNARVDLVASVECTIPLTFKCLHIVPER